MALTSDQKKHLLIGGGIGALAVFLGSAIFGGRRAEAAPFAIPRRPELPSRMTAPRDHDHHRRKRRHRDDRDYRDDNDRGEYGRKKHKRRGRHD